MKNTTENLWQKYKPYIISSAIALGVGGISAFISRGGMENYANVNQPPLSPPMWLFPIVWGILYILMGIGAAEVYLSEGENRLVALRVYAVQLAVNFLWSPIFFNAQAFVVAFIWIVILWLLIIFMIALFWSVKPRAAYLQLPYLIWVTFAGYLTYMTYLLNR